MRLWTPYPEYGLKEGAAVFGDQGYLLIGIDGWRAYGPDNELRKQARGDHDTAPHVEDFIGCVKSRQRPHCDLETIGHRASLLCHTGNIAVRVGRTLEFDAKTESFVDDADANALRGRPEWRKPWSLPQV
jgi:hypothetical protein